MLYMVVMGKKITFSMNLLKMGEIYLVGGTAYVCMCMYVCMYVCMMYRPLSIVKCDDFLSISPART